MDYSRGIVRDSAIPYRMDLKTFCIMAYKNKITFRKAFLLKYPNRQNVINHWEQATETPFEWKSVNKRTIMQFKRVMQDKISISSLRLYCAYMRATINENNDIARIPADVIAAFTSRNDKPQNVFLTMEEISKLANIQLFRIGDLIVRDSFLLEALTGARRSDCIGLDKSNIHNGNIEYISKKTRIRSCIPIGKQVRDILDRGYYNRRVSATYYSMAIKDICKRAGITNDVRLYQKGKWVTKPKYEFVTSHTARRSFATNVYEQCKDVLVVSRLMGHTNPTQTTDRYIMNLDYVPNEVVQFLKDYNPKTDKND